MVYLGYLTTEDGRCEAEIKRRITIARSSFENMSKVLTSRHININLRQRILRCYIWSTLLYGAETWTYRRMLKLSWAEHKSNGEVLRMFNTQRPLLSTIMKRILTYFGHITRKNNIEGKTDGRRGRGRPRTNWTDNIKDWAQMKYCECIRLAQDKQKWRLMTANLLRADGT